MTEEDRDKLIDCWDKINLVYYEMCTMIVEKEYDMNGMKVYQADLRSMALRFRLSIQHLWDTVENIKEISNETK